MPEITILPYELFLLEEQTTENNIPDHLQPFLEDGKVNVGYKIGNEYTKIILSFWDEIEKYFHKITLHEKWHEQYDIISTCYSDIIKLFIVKDWIEQWRSDDKIKRVLLLMKNDEHFYCAFEWNPLNKNELDKIFEKGNFIGDYLSDKSYARLYTQGEFGTSEEQEEWKKTFQEVDKVFSIVPFYIETYTFERVLFDIINKNSHYFLIICYDEYWNIENIQYSSNNNLWDNLFTSKRTEVHRIDSYLLLHLHSKSNSLDFWEQFKSSKSVMDNLRKRIKDKKDFLQHLKNQVVSLWETIQRHKQGSAKHSKLLAEQTQYQNLILRIENELELKDYYLYDYMTKPDTVIATLPPIKNIQEVRKHIGGMVEWNVAFDVKHKTVQNIEIFQKDFMRTEAELRESHPYAEIWWQQHNRKHKFSTLRYKKRIE